MKRVVPETPILLPVEKKRRGNVEEQAPISTTTKIAHEQSQPIWGFETIPIVATIGPRGKYHGSSWIPRILAWSCQSILQYSKLATSVFDRKDEVDAALYYIRRRIINSPQMYDQRAIVTDCMFWSSIHARYTKYLKEQSEHREGDELSDTVDWEKEMKDSPFDMYALCTLPVGSKSWLEVNYVYVPVNNNNKHWLAAKVNIRNRAITLYDPNNPMSQDEFQCRNAKCLSILFSYLLMVHG
ncbi:hypothetical protein FNV43_RR10976 [Rhamnella rubrinervis]|uniref:Ubiquitin-like protease family profile domain-containing protein n=1 Tax=Rhamnella rubrinervis TaxID=2594499 RepID=A0A8K0H590_9ROSA|nr:hypothetical protein FNV43_RR10976 [Rhamnella rubrinervis]